MSILESLKRLFGGGAAKSGANQNGGDGMMPCEDALSRLYEFLDGELPPTSRERVEAHFEVCKRCYPHLHLEQSFRSCLQRAFEGGHAPEGLRSRVLELIEQEES